MTQSHVVDAFLSALPSVAELLRAEEVAARWDEPSALEDMSIGALAEHLGEQITMVPGLLAAPWRYVPATSLDEYYRTAVWVGASIESDFNRHIRQSAQEAGAEGAQALVSRVNQAITAIEHAFHNRPADAVVYARAGTVPLTPDDYLRTRIMELAVHSDDLAVSIGLPTPELAVTAQNIVIALLGRIAVGRHGWTDVLRALARTERAPKGGISAL